MEYRVDFLDKGVTVTVSEGMTLLEAQIRAKLPADAPCGGRGTCGKCAVKYRRAGEEDWKRGLACRLRVDGDCEVLLLHGDEKLQVLTGDVKDMTVWNPMVKITKISVEPCRRGDSTADWSRLCAALDGTWQFLPRRGRGFRRWGCRCNTRNIRSRRKSASRMRCMRSRRCGWTDRRSCSRRCT